jgi:DNA-binding winged helix-turn-helix (wHTH) protein
MRACFGEFVLDEDDRELLRSGSAVHLTPKAYALLAYLSARPHRAIPKSELLEHLWPGVFVTEAALTTVVKELRRALGDSASAPRYLRGVRGFGYAFNAEPISLHAVRVGEASPPAAAHEYRLVWQGREVALAEGANLLGRTHEAAVWVEHPSVSRRHAIVCVAGGEATVEDCGSKNGTFVDGERITAPRPIRSGDRLWLGQACLQLVRYVADQSTRSSP